MITIHEVVGNGLEKHSIDKYSVMLLVLLTVPIAVMALLLLVCPDVYWRSIVPFGVVDVLGCFAMILLAVFLVARYTRQSGIIYFSAALITMSVTEGFYLLTTPDAPHYTWLKFFSGIAGGLLTLRYIMARKKRPESGIEQVNSGRTMLILGGVAAAAALLSWIILKFSSHWPALSVNNVFTPAGWTMYGIVVSILSFAGARLFMYFRKTGNKEVLPVAIVLIFLFQGNEATQIAPSWSIVWWFWQGMRVMVFVAALIYVLSGYIRLSNSLILEVQERKRVVDELAAANANWYSSFNSLEDAMLIIDHKYRLMNMNDSAVKLLGKMRREILGKYIDRVVHTGTLSPDGAIFHQVLDTRAPVSIEEYNERLGRHFCIKCSPVTDQKQRIVRFVILLHDVTQRVDAETTERKLQQELSHASRLAAIGELAATVAHEMNNPLTSVIGFSELLKSAEVSENVKENLDIINHSAQRAAGVVQKLLSFARQRKDDRNPADINNIVSLAVKMRSNELRMNNIEVKTSLEEDLPMLVVDSAQMEQVLLNMIINAEQAMIKKMKGGRLFIRTSRKGNLVRIQIADNGVGISGDNLENIFKTFFTTRVGEGGTGLGLGVCRSIINDHKGRIFVSSRYGKGTCFTIELPVGAPNALEMETVTPPKCLPQLGSRVLVVDDELSVRLMINRVLSREGYSVDTAENGKIALEEYRKNKYDLLLVDIRMPDMDGMDLYYHLREMNPDIINKIIFITGDLMGSRSRLFIQENKLPALAKPFGIQDLRQQVESVLSGVISEKQSPNIVTQSFKSQSALSQYS